MLVIGCGGVGLNVVQGARLAGARTIIACDLLDNKLAYAKTFGATHTINAKLDDVVKQVQALTDGLGVDAAFDAIGGEATALQALDAVAPGGHAVLVGIPAFGGAGADQPVQHGVRRKDDQRHLLRFGASRHRFPDPRRSRHGQEAQSRRPDQPYLQIRRDQRGLSPIAVRLSRARRDSVRLTVEHKHSNAKVGDLRHGTPFGFEGAQILSHLKIRGDANYSFLR